MGGCHMVAELVVRGHGCPLHSTGIVTYPDQLGDIAGQALDTIRHDLGFELHSPCFARHVRAVRLGHVPVGTG